MKTPADCIGGFLVVASQFNFESIRPGEAVH